MNSVTEYVTAEEPQHLLLPAPGVQLRMAREAAHLSVEDIANQLHLRVSAIDALERDDYASFPALAFVRGYLRSYAKTVKISPDKVIEAFNQLEITEEKKAPAPAVRAVSFTASDRAFKWVTYSVVTGLLILIFLGWETHHSHSVDLATSVDKSVNFAAANTASAVAQPANPPSSTEAVDAKVNAAENNETVSASTSQTSASAPAAAANNSASVNIFKEGHATSAEKSANTQQSLF